MLMFNRRYIQMIVIFFVHMKIKLLTITDKWNRICKINISGCSAAGSAPALGAGCRTFEPCHSDQAPRNRCFFLASETPTGCSGSGIAAAGGGRRQWRSRKKHRAMRSAPSEQSDNVSDRKLVARLLWEQDVARSNRVTPTKKKKLL